MLNQTVKNKKSNPYEVKVNKRLNIILLVSYICGIILMLFIFFDTYAHNDPHGYIYSNPISHFKALFGLFVILPLWSSAINSNILTIKYGWCIRIENDKFDAIYKGKLHKDVPISEVINIERVVSNKNLNVRKWINSKPIWYGFKVNLKSKNYIGGRNNFMFYAYCKNHSPDEVIAKLSEYFGEIKTVTVEENI